MIVTVSGKSYAAAIADSQVPTEEGWPEPGYRHVGRGRRYIYNVEPRIARLIESHLRDVGESLAGGDPDARADARAILRDADAIAERFQ